MWGNGVWIPNWLAMCLACFASSSFFFTVVGSWAHMAFKLALCMHMSSLKSSILPGNASHPWILWKWPVSHWNGSAKLSPLHPTGNCWASMLLWVTYPSSYPSSSSGSIIGNRPWSIALEQLPHHTLWQGGQPPRLDKKFVQNIPSPFMISCWQQRQHLLQVVHEFCASDLPGPMS